MRTGVGGSLFAALVLVALLAGCGGGRAKPSTTSTRAQSSASSSANAPTTTATASRPSLAAYWPYEKLVARLAVGAAGEERAAWDGACHVGGHTRDRLQAFLALLIEAGHSPAGAERLMSDLPTWQTAPARAVTALAARFRARGESGLRVSARTCAPRARRWRITEPPGRPVAPVTRIGPRTTDQSRVL